VKPASKDIGNPFKKVTGNVLKNLLKDKILSNDSLPEPLLSVSECDANLSDEPENVENVCHFPQARLSTEGPSLISLPESSRSDSAGVESIKITEESIQARKPKVPKLDFRNSPLKAVVPQVSEKLLTSGRIVVKKRK